MVCIATKDANLYGFHLEGKVPNITTLTIKCNYKNHLCNVYIKVILIYFTNTIHSLSLYCTKCLFFTGFFSSKYSEYLHLSFKNTHEPISVRTAIADYECVKSD